MTCGVYLLIVPIVVLIDVLFGGAQGRSLILSLLSILPLAGLLIYLARRYRRWRWREQ